MCDLGRPADAADYAPYPGARIVLSISRTDTSPRRSILTSAFHVASRYAPVSHLLTVGIEDLPVITLQIIAFDGRRRRNGGDPQVQIRYPCGHAEGMSFKLQKLPVLYSESAAELGDVFTFGP